MRILLIANRFNKIFKIDSGGALRNNLFVRALSEIGHEIANKYFSQDRFVEIVKNAIIVN